MQILKAQAGAMKEMYFEADGHGFLAVQRGAEHTPDSTWTPDCAGLAFVTGLRMEASEFADVYLPASLHRSTLLVCHEAAAVAWIVVQPLQTCLSIQGPGTGDGARCLQGHGPGWKHQWCRRFCHDRAHFGFEGLQL